MLCHVVEDLEVAVGARRVIGRAAIVMPIVAILGKYSAIQRSFCISFASPDPFKLIMYFCVVGKARVSLDKLVHLLRTLHLVDVFNIVLLPSILHPAQ